MIASSVYIISSYPVKEHIFILIYINYCHKNSINAAANILVHLIGYTCMYCKRIPTAITYIEHPDVV